jgi:hypothetical protein
MLWSRPKVSEKERPQRELKATLLLAASAQLGVDALGVGDGDLAFGLDFLVDGAKEHCLPYVSANLANPAGELIFPPVRRVERGGMTFGITSVLLDTHQLDGTTILPVNPAVAGAVAELQGTVDFVVVLSGLGLKEDEKLAEAVPGIDLIFGSHTRKMQVDPIIVGSTAIFQAGSRGKYLGEVTLEIREGGVGWSNEEGRERALRRLSQIEEQLRRYDRQIEQSEDPRSKDRLTRLRKVTQGRYDDIRVPPEDDGSTHVITGRSVPMGKDLEDEPEMKKLVDATLDQLGEVGGGDDGHGHGHRSETRTYGDYVGSSTCLACHREQYTDWKTTGHARAYKTLVVEKRQFDNDCWSCHVTGANKPGGPEHAKEVGSMRNVQCEACHGAGRQHASNPTSVDMVKTPVEAKCLECHTEEQTEGRFVYADYLPRVDHVD